MNFNFLLSTHVPDSDFPELITVWERSVRATHDFLPSEFIDMYKPKILTEYFYMVNLIKITLKSGKIVGFLGTADHRIEMLFIEPSYRRQHIGSHLLLYAIEQLNCTEVDVNEQNTQAVSFYVKHGFQITHRSETDAQGNPYPLLTLHLIH